MTMDNMQYVKKLLADAVAAGHVLKCHAEGDVDYIGTDVAKAFEAIEACDDEELTICAKDTMRQIAWVQIMQDATDPEEAIADYSGFWMDVWWNENISEKIGDGK